MRLKSFNLLNALSMWATSVIPIVFAAASDPVGSGFVASLARPGGNVTGFTILEGSVAGKWLELLKEIAPRVARVAFLFNPKTAPYAEYYLKSFRTAAASFAVEAVAAPVHDTSELASAIATLALEPNCGVIVMPDASMDTYRTEIISLAARNALPAVSARGDLRRPYSKGRQACRSTCAGAGEICARDQPQDRESARP